MAAGRSLELRVAAAEDIVAAIDRLKMVDEAPSRTEGAAGGGDGDEDIEHLKD